MAQLRLARVKDDGVLYCEHCGLPIIKAYDCIGHHKVELTDTNVNDYDISLNAEMVILVHHQCHNAIHERFGYDSTRHIYLIYGPPGAGKADYLEKAVGKDDLILDLDNLYCAITNRARYDHNKRVSNNVFGLRDCLLDMIKTRTGKWKNAYIVGGYPLANERERLCDQLGAEPIYLQSTKEECLLNVMERAGDQKKYIEQWFSMYTE